MSKEKTTTAAEVVTTAVAEPVAQEAGTNPQLPAAPVAEPEAEVVPVYDDGLTGPTDFADLTGEDLWGALTEKLRGYVYLQTNKGLVRVPIQQTVQEEVDEAVKALLKVPTLPKKKVVDPENPKKKIEELDHNDPAYQKAVDEYGLMMTLIALDFAVTDKPKGAELLGRCERYKRLSTSSLATFIDGITDLNNQRLTSDMRRDEQNGIPVSVGQLL